MQLELAALDRAPQALLGGEARSGCLEQLRAEYANPAAALCLGMEERGIRGPQQPFGVAPMVREDAGAEAEAHEQFAPVDDQRLLETADDPVGCPLDVLRAPRRCANHRELVAAEARAVAEVADGGAQALGHGLQHAVAEHVTHAVVDVLEVVEVQEEHAREGVLRCGAGERLVQLHQELPPVGKPGQRVVGREVHELSRAVFDLRLELAVILAGDFLRGAQPLRHLVEGDRERVEFLGAAARYGDARPRPAPGARWHAPAGGPGGRRCAPY